MIDEMLELLIILNEKKEIWDSIAACYRNAFDALIRAGFTQEQAMEIISRQALGIKA